ncbi:hypothetical protein HYALB_00002537 [Hymenoscyphus albidus]|uniref:DUF7492 domain-containing protein n=1 Tax=Hymenoscyphus albidus TaxID=595503 RepID=A0A9N9LSL9_9HELO|nr:hypothetical protein HYALB_00002537 [Hymenoscyphus albidus]
MRTSLFATSQLAALALLLCVTPSQAHTWVEALQLIGSNGAFTGPEGFMRGYIARTDAGFDDRLMTNRFTGPEISDRSPMCRQTGDRGDQGVGKQFGKPLLKAAPTDWVAIKYSDNGHVTLPLGPRPAGNGTIYVYGTKNSLNSDTLLGIHKKWNAAGDGGDKRGKLLATRFYDDGQCHEDSGNPIAVQRKAAQEGMPRLFCQTDVQLPEDAGTDGLYTLYWVWDYALMTDAGAVANQEMYTSCMDISMTSQKTTNKIDFKPAKGKGVENTAIKAQLDSAFIADPLAKPVLESKLTPYVPNNPAKGPNDPKDGAPSAPPATAPSPSSSKKPEASNPPPKEIPTLPTSSQEACKTVTVTYTPAAVTVYMTATAPPPGVLPTKPSTSPSLAPSQRPAPTNGTGPAPTTSHSAPNNLQTSKPPAPDQAKQTPAAKPAVTPFLQAGQNYPKFIRAARAFHE